MENKLIGEILMANGIINQDQLTHALNVQKKQGGLIGLILIELNIITANQPLLFSKKSDNKYHLPIVCEHET